MPETISCLMVTHGRYRHVQSALACFLAQDYPHKELLILNHHEVPLVFNHPQVCICNRPGEQTFGASLNYLLDRASGEYVRTWDDDDFYFPWCISQGVASIGDAAAWKPHRSWFYDGQKGTVGLSSNNFEPSVLWRTDTVRAVGYDDGHHEHSRLHAAVTIRKTEVGCWSPFLTTWGTGVWHLSGGLGNGQTPEQRAASWRHNNQDHGYGKALEVSYSALEHWLPILEQVSQQVPECDREEWCRKAGLLATVE